MFVPGPGALTNPPRSVIHGQEEKAQDLHTCALDFRSSVSLVLLRKYCSWLEIFWPTFTVFCVFEVTVSPF